MYKNNSHNKKAKILLNAFIVSQFNYSPLVSMFCRKTLYSKIRKIYHKYLKVISESNDICINVLLHSNTASVHQRHFKILMTEYIKACNH